MKRFTSYCLCLLFIYSKIYGGISNSDSLAVRAILDSNNLTSIPITDVVFYDSSTSRIITLDLSNKNIETMPVSIGELTELQFLHLHNNRLKELPSEIGNLRKLKELRLNDNRLTDLPDSIVNLELGVAVYDSLSADIFIHPGLYISHNRLCTLSTDIQSWIRTTIQNSGTYEPNWQETQDCGSNSKKKIIDHKSKHLQRVISNYNTVHSDLGNGLIFKANGSRILSDGFYSLPVGFYFAKIYHDKVLRLLNRP